RDGLVRITEITGEVQGEALRRGYETRDVAGGRRADHGLDGFHQRKSGRSGLPRDPEGAFGIEREGVGAVVEGPVACSAQIGGEEQVARRGIELRNKRGSRGVAGDGLDG